MDVYNASFRASALRVVSGPIFLRTSRCTCSNLVKCSIERYGADALPPPLSGLHCGMLAVVMRRRRRHPREKLDRPRCAIINLHSDVFGNARPQYQLMYGSSQGCEASALPPCTERHVQRVTSKVGREPGSQFCSIFQCRIALLILRSHCFYPWIHGDSTP